MEGEVQHRQEPASRNPQEGDSDQERLTTMGSNLFTCKRARTGELAADFWAFSARRPDRSAGG